MAAAAAAAAAATLYGSSILPSICMQNVFMHYQKLIAECQTLGLNKLTPYGPPSTVLASPAKSEKMDEEPHPLGEISKIIIFGFLVTNRGHPYATWSDFR